MALSKDGFGVADPCAEAHEPLMQAAALLRGAQHAIALTGAGLSTHSGIPDFRSPSSGLWEHADPGEVASLMGFRRNPQKFFDWFRPLARIMIEARPNAAHLALARLEEIGIIEALITQNIDLLHARAGSKRIYELHGHIREATCVECFRVYPTESFIDRYLNTGEVPHCPHCGGVLKPNAILFGEQLPYHALHAAQQAARRCSAMLVAGSSLSVAPASDLPMIALAHGAQLIIINYEPTYVDERAAVVIHDDVAVILPCLVSLLEGNAHD
jgi:NAD-dependent deacetylase